MSAAPVAGDRSARQYVDHIDGLRALAVLLVLLFHLHVPGVDGGFVGVDVFFVISGYLMTRILGRMVDRREPLSHFFASRFRRIVPAYAVLLAVASVAALVVFLPVHLEMLVAGLVSAALFLSNIVFWRTTDYFSPDLSYNVLLHTWSLSVEWQFYLVYPLLFLAARRWHWSRRLILLVAGLGSLALAVILVAHSKEVPAFYLLPTRIWEFVVGGALVEMPRMKLGRPLQTALAWLGLALILYCALAYIRTTPFPGVAALWPCLGAALLIQCGGEAIGLTPILSAAPVRLLGQASYSVYLWHWPLIVITEYRLVGNPADAPAGLVIALALVSLALGFASWHWVEKPYRMHADGRQNRALAWMVPVSAIPLACAATIMATHGLPARFSPAVVALSDAYQDVGRYRDCLSRTPGADGSVGNLCHLGVDGQAPDFLLFGDSHAAAFADGMSQLASERGWSGYLSAADACPPLLDFPGGYLPTKAHCDRLQASMKALVAAVRPRRVFLHAAWRSLYRRDRPLLESQLDATLAWLTGTGADVVVIGDTPGALDNVPLGMAKQLAFGLPQKPVDSSEFLARNQAVDALLAQKARAHGARFVDLARPLCESSANCRETADGYPLYWDSNHLSGRGSIYLVKLVSGAIDGQAAAPPSAALAAPPAPQ